jgi:tyrosine-protein kinase Etk/Wzc
MSSRFDDLMKFARANYDVVILDAPPAGMALDAAIVTRYSDLCILVARYAQTREFQVLDSLRDLSRVGVPLCTLLNQVPQTELRQYVHGR